MRIVRVIHQPSGRALAERAKVAENIPNRALGLLVMEPLRTGEGLWLLPASGIHTLGMDYSIDVVFLDSELNVVRMESELAPYRVAWKPGLGIASVLELPAGVLKSIGVEVGDALQVESLEFGGEPASAS